MVTGIDKELNTGYKVNYKPVNSLVTTFMIYKQVGGRGKKAPYETTHVRIPKDIKHQVEALVEKFRNDGNVCLEEIDEKLVENDLDKHRELLDLLINEFKENGLYIGQDDRLKPRHSVPVLKEEAFKIASNLVKVRGTKKEFAKILLARIYGIETDDVNLD